MTAAMLLVSTVGANSDGRPDGGDESLSILTAMRKVLVVADELWVRNEVHAGLTRPDIEVTDHEDPTSAADVAVASGADVAVVDLQIGSMGGMAVTRAIRHESASADGPGIPVVLLLDREADVFLARRAGAAAWVVKPFTSHQLRSALDPLLAAPGDAAEG